MKSINQFRRKYFLIGLVTPVLLFTACVGRGATPLPIQVDVAGVTDVPGLIRAIRKSAGKSIPDSVRDEEFHAALAKVFVQNARSAVAQGYRVPDSLLSEIPSSGTSGFLPVLGVAIFTIYNVTFMVPVATIIAAVLASLTIMMAALYAAIRALVRPTK